MNEFTQHLYSIVSRDISSAVIVLSDEHHPIFKAHFEGNPLLPAFLHVDIAAEIFGFVVSGIIKSKFIIPLVPDDEVVVNVQPNSFGVKVRFIKDTKLASEMVLEI
jgi:3-hydroxyacyl-[acyl-carrier-protein] dehydratase